VAQRAVPVAHRPPEAGVLGRRRTGPTLFGARSGPLPTRGGADGRAEDHSRDPDFPHGAGRRGSARIHNRRRPEYVISRRRRTPAPAMLGTGGREAPGPGGRPRGPTGDARPKYRPGMDTTAGDCGILWGDARPACDVSACPPCTGTWNQRAVSAVIPE
jgi:hypothetical protein